MLPYLPLGLERMGDGRQGSIIPTVRQPFIGLMLFARKGPMPMILVLLMAFEISVALALGFVLGRIYQIRHDELERRDGFALPPTARIPQA